MVSDFKYALRQLAKSPGFTLCAVLTLALGIGANTAIFSVIHAVLLSALPVSDPQRLVFLTDPNEHGFYGGNGNGRGVHSGNETDDGNRKLLTYAEFQALNGKVGAFSEICAVDGAVRWRAITMVGEKQTWEYQPTLSVSGSYFSVLGVNPALGRVFGPEVDRTRDAFPVAVISYQYWQGALGRDPAVIGRRIRISNTIYDIIGVAPRGFYGETVGQFPIVWVPLTMQREISPGVDLLSEEKNPLSKFMAYQVIGRLRPGVAIGAASAEANLVFHRYLAFQAKSIPHAEREKFLSQRLALVSGGRGASTLRSGYGEPLVILMGLVGLLLLVACGNVSNLLLARAVARQKEVAIRVAIGATPARIFRQLLTESVVLALLGGMVGVLLAQWGQAALLHLVDQPLDAPIDLPILAFTLAVSLVVGVIFGAAPALQATRIDLNVFLKGLAGSSGGGGRLTVSQALVIGQIAFSITLVIVAGLFIHSFQNLKEAPLGYDHDHLLVLRVRLANSGYKGEAVRQLHQKLGERIKAIPGVKNVTFSRNGLFTGIDDTEPIWIDGIQPVAGMNPNAACDQIGPGYFSTLGIPLVMGRELGPQDMHPGQRYGIINHAMAQYYFGSANPLGQRIHYGDSQTDLDFVVAGVAADAKYAALNETPTRRFYVPVDYPPDRWTDVLFEIRAKGDPGPLSRSITAAVRTTAPGIFRDINTMNEITDQTLGLDRLLTRLSGFFGALAAVLASVGIYGVMSYAVARRTREIGVRMALGSTRSRILRMILGDSLRLVLGGVIVGIPVAIGAGKAMANLLYELPAADLEVLGAAALAMLVVGAIASYLPAQRATQVDPLTALRME